MRSVSLRNSIVVLAAFLLGIATTPLGLPLWKQFVMWVSHDQYATLVFKCDNAMREHMRAKQLVSREPSERHVDVLESAELALLDCQDYDLMRKRLKQYGITDNELSLMGLQAIEEQAKTLQKVIEIHEIRY